MNEMRQALKKFEDDHICVTDADIIAFRKGYYAAVKDMREKIIIEKDILVEYEENIFD
jgi:hypothetical protein